MESDYCVKIMGKFLFYLAVLPEDISLMRNSFYEFPEDDICLHKSHLNLIWQIENNYSKKILESFNIFNEYGYFIDKLCEAAESSKVDYQPENGGNKLVLIEQICYSFFSEVLISHF